MPEEEKHKKKYTAHRISKEEMEKITSLIDQRLHDFIREGHYKDVLIAMGNLGNYSLNNQIYILIQKPDAVTVHGMNQWNYMGRHVIPGSKSIRIFSPIMKNVERPLKDEDGNDVVGKDGKPVMVSQNLAVGYKTAYVFDVSQTDGRPIKAFKFDEKQVVENKQKILTALRKAMAEKGFSVSYATKEELGAGCYGLCNHQAHEIRILSGMSDLQEISTTVHECGHALAHSAYRKDFEGLTPMEKREIKEVEAESIACVVCTFLGLDTSNFNFSYIAGWSEGDISKFRQNLDVISKHARTLLRAINRELAPTEKNKKKEQKEKAKPPLADYTPLPNTRVQEAELG